MTDEREAMIRATWQGSKERWRASRFWQTPAKAADGGRYPEILTFEMTPEGVICDGLLVAGREEAGTIVSRWHNYPRLGVA